LPKSITHVQPPLKFIPPAYNSLVRRGVRSLLPWIRRYFGIVDVQVDRAEVLSELFDQFQMGKVRFLIAFRHPSPNDPLCMATLVWNWVPHMARQQGIALKKTTHVHFIYDRGIPLWAGWYVGWIYAGLGGTPIRRGKADLMGLRSIRQLFASGRFPMAAAPEGATNGQGGMVSPIEPGIAQFGFWCIEDLLKADRSEQVLIVPIGIQYRFVDAPWQSVAELLERLEIDSGLAPSESDAILGYDRHSLTGKQEAVLYQRLFRLGEHLLTQMEKFYSKFYHQLLPTAVATAKDAVAIASNPSGLGSPEANEKLAKRLNNLLNAALSVAEHAFNLPPKGSLTDRCRRLEQAGWDRIYREDLQQLESLSAVDRGLADRVAEEADLRLWHMRLVETFTSVTGRYVLEKPTVERFAETALLLWDMVSRLKGEYPFPRPQLGAQRVQMTVGEPISVSDRWQDYQSNRRHAVADLTQDLQIALESLIKI
jgi:1-acyl-sn-glycerol-3-phosphate acyltransferase